MTKPVLCETFTPQLRAGTQSDGSSRLRWRGEPVYIFTGLGCFAEYVVVPEESCVPIREDVPLEVAALVGCAVSTGVGAALYTAEVRPGQSAAVYGAGGVGLNIIQGAALAGAYPVIAIDTNSSTMEIAPRVWRDAHAVLGRVGGVADPGADGRARRGSCL